MKATNAYAAKRALIDRLTALSQVVGHPLEGVQVAYDKPGDMKDRCIYGGWARFTRGEGAAEGVLAQETVLVDLYVRVLGRALDARATEALVEGLGDVIADELARDPELTGELTYEQIKSGTAGNVAVDDGTEALLPLSIQIESWLG